MTTVPDDVVRTVAVLSFPLVVFLFLIIWLGIVVRGRRSVDVAMKFLGMTLRINAGRVDDPHPNKRIDDDLPTK